MKKRFWAMSLAVSMLLGVFTIFAGNAALAAQETAATAESGDATYLDLYVKDGLVAIFDGYGMTASEEKLSSFAPLDLYGKSGYEDYLDPASYTYALRSGASYKWQSTTGGLKPTVLDTAVNIWGECAYLDLDALGAKLSYTYTVEEVYTHDALVPAVKDGVLTNYTVVKKPTGRPSVAWLGAYNFGGAQYSGGGADGEHNLVAVVMEQMQFGSKYIGHFTWLEDTGASVNYSTLLGDDGTELNNYYVGVGSYTLTRTIARLGVIETTQDQDGTSVKAWRSDYSIHYDVTPWSRSSNLPADGIFTYTSDAEADHKSTKMQLAADHATVHSIRIYDRALAKDEIHQNHLADLCAIYAYDGVDGILALDASALARLALTTATVQLENYLGDGDKFLAGRNDFIALVDAFLEGVGDEGEGREMTAYDALYVGADGEKSELGASLIALYSAYAGSTGSVSLSSGLWMDKVGENNATVLGGVYSASSKKYGWKLRADGGIGYDMSLEYNAAPNSTSMNRQPTVDNAIVLNPDLISHPDFTVEYVASYELYSLTRNGTVLGDFVDHVIDDNGTRLEKKSHWADDPIPTDTIGILKNYATRAGVLEGTSYRGVRWCVVPPEYDYITGGETFGYNTQLWTDTSRSTTNIYNQSIVKDETALDAGEYQAEYIIYADGARKVGGTYYTFEVKDPVEKNSKLRPYYRNVANAEFKLFNQVPVSVYAIRVYDGVLTQAEMKYNRLIDLAAYCGADLSAFESLGREEQAIVVDMMSQSPYSMDASAFDEMVEGFGNMLSGGAQAKDSLYVQGGLTVLLASYAGFSTGYVHTASDRVLWVNGVDNSTHGILKGTGWEAGVSGGFTIVKTPLDYYGTDISREPYGLDFDGDLLPDGNYTVELVANPVGITNEDGTRYIDDKTPNGTYIENGFALGPLRALQFSCYRPAGLDAQMDRRWVYGKGSHPLQDASFKAAVQDFFWRGLALDEIVTLRISLQQTDVKHIYAIAQGNDRVGFEVSKDKVLTNEEADNMFRLMNNVAGTIFSVRVYDRLLTDAEVAQNRMADLIYYYDIDVGIVGEVIAAAGSAAASLAEAFSDFNFTMEKTRAQELFDRHIVAAWLSYDGFGVRKDMTNGIRYYFNANLAALNAAVVAGMKVEAGAIVSVGKSALPVLDGYGYDYKVVAFDDVAGKTQGFYIDEDTFAVTVRYRDDSKSSLVSSVVVRGYVKLTDVDGNETVYYTLLNEDVPCSMFEGYYLLNDAANESLISNTALAEHVSRQVGRSYTDLYVYLDASAKTNGDGSKEAPYANVADAFAKCRELQKGINRPTNLYLEVADGRYPIHSTVMLEGEDNTYRFAEFIVTSKGGAVFTTGKTIDSATFTLEGDSIYSYQMEADGAGNYPAFRTLYVDGERATIATNGSSRSADREDIFLTATNRDFSVNGDNAISVGKLYMPEELVGDLKDLIASGKAQLAPLAEKLLSDAAKQVSDTDAVYSEAKRVYNDAAAVNEALLLLENVPSKDLVSTVDERIDELSSSLSTSQDPHKTSVMLDAYKSLKDSFGEDVARAYRNAVSASMNELTVARNALSDAQSAYEAALGAERTAKSSAAEMMDDTRWIRYALMPYSIELHMSVQWDYNIVHIDGVDYDDYTDINTSNGVERHVAVYVNRSEYSQFAVPGGYSTKNRHVYMQNAPAYLDENGEYYYDEGTGKLYFYSTEGMHGKKIEYATLDHMFIIRNMTNLSFENITFTGTDDYYLTRMGLTSGVGGDDNRHTGLFGLTGDFPDRCALYMENCTGVSVENCQFLSLPCEGISVRGWLEDATFKGNVFEHLGGTALRIGQYVKKPPSDGSSWIEGVWGSRDVSVTDNYLHDIAYVYKTPALMITKLHNGDILNNTIKGCAYTGMSIGWDWGINSSYKADESVNVRNVDIAYNYITDFMTEMADGGAIYMPVQNGTVGNGDFYINRVRENFIMFSKNTGDGLGGMVVGIYFDASTSNWHCYGNVIAEQSYGAVATESDYAAYGMTAEEAHLKQLRRQGSFYIYLQHIDTQETHNILVEENHILNVRNTVADKQHREVYQNYFSVKDAVNGRNLIERNTEYIQGIGRVSIKVEELIDAAGAKGYRADAYELFENVY